MKTNKSRLVALAFVGNLAACANNPQIENLNGVSLGPASYESIKGLNDTSINPEDYISKQTIKGLNGQTLIYDGSTEEIKDYTVEGTENFDWN